jgi:formylglycine-generating enzyme required for sulfatase activity
MAGRMNEDKLNSFYTWATVFRGHQLAAADLATKKPGDAFFECVKIFSTDRDDDKEIPVHCPEMVVVPAGAYKMGGKNSERIITIARPFAVSRFPITFDQWDACVTGGGCEQNVRPSDQTWGRGTRPVINVDWRDANTYVAWLNRMTGTDAYRLLTEAQWEYAARGIKSAEAPHPEYPWGDIIGKDNANCIGCGSQWDYKQTAPVGSFKQNAFGLYDMHGNVWQWVEDCYAELGGAPTDGTAPKAACRDSTSLRVVRGGSWQRPPEFLRSSFRGFDPPPVRYSFTGFRIARVLSPARKH